MYESLWIDKAGADDTLAQIAADSASAEVAALLAHYRDFGFCIIPGAVAPDIIDRYRRHHSALIADGTMKIARGGAVVAARDVDLTMPSGKFLDAHAISAAAQRICFAPKLAAFLQHLFGEPALAFQSLHFEIGSTQRVHTDTAFVVVDEPKSLTASWVALEDVGPGTGELVYYPGSHRFDDFLYRDARKHWSKEDDGVARNEAHLNWIHEEAARRGIALQSFRPRKGDALFWHADLAHGGGPITRPGATRRSLVTHYCPARCTPHYFQFLPPKARVKRKVGRDAYVSSSYYPLGGLFASSRAAMRRLLRK